jgi:hypothetical protein
MCTLWLVKNLKRIEIWRVSTSNFIKASAVAFSREQNKVRFFHTRFAFNNKLGSHTSPANITHVNVIFTNTLRRKTALLCLLSVKRQVGSPFYFFLCMYILFFLNGLVDDVTKHEIPGRIYDCLCAHRNVCFHYLDRCNTRVHALCIYTSIKARSIADRKLSTLGTRTSHVNLPIVSQTTSVSTSLPIWYRRRTACSSRHTLLKCTP